VVPIAPSTDTDKAAVASVNTNLLAVFMEGTSPCWCVNIILTEFPVLLPLHTAVSLLVAVTVIDEIVCSASSFDCKDSPAPVPIEVPDSLIVVRTALYAIAVVVSPRNVIVNAPAFALQFKI
jgi:hypothetical protein